LGDALCSGTFRFSPVRLIDLKNGHQVEVWDAEDSLVQKMLGLLLTRLLSSRLSPRCFHLSGRGGLKGGVRALRDALASGKFGFVMRSDVRGYYANISHGPLLEELRHHVDDPTILDLVSQYCHRTVVRGGLYRFITKGIPLGSPLSPLMGALYLDRLDRRMEALEDIFYVRFNSHLSQRGLPPVNFPGEPTHGEDT
jgi:RNA-directed DNA polymerase